MLGRTDPDLRGRLLLDVLREQKAAGRWAGEPDEFFARLVADAHVGRSTTRVMEQRGRSVRVVTQPMNTGGWVATFEDITEWQQAQAQISHMARHDALTNLPNRTLFREELERALHLVKRTDQLAVLCLDLDHFKKVNDSLGHPVGDALLKQVAARLRTCIGPGDTVARLGGDEFAIVQFCNGCDPSTVPALASQIVEIVAAPYEIEGHQLVIGVSIGISLAPEDGDDPDQLLKNADLALYRAKADGRGTYRFFEAGMDARAQARRLLELDLRLALQRDEFEVHYQPIRDLASGEIVVCEALVRWSHPERGLIAPDQFIPIAEETGLIVPLGDWVLRTACAEAARWPSACVAVNLSPVQFRNPRPGGDREGGAAAVRPAGAIASSSRSPNRCCCRTAKRRSPMLHELARLRRQDFARRFRHRLFLAELSAQLPVRQDQDRPLVRQRARHAQGLARDRSRGDRARQEPRHRHHRGRRRDR